MDQPSNEKKQVVGMSLRDYFAAHAIDAAYHHCRKTGPLDPKRVAEYAYQLADAMMGEKR